MEQINEIIKKQLNTLTSNGRRVFYSPYKLDVALSVIDRIGKGLEPKFSLTPEVELIYIELIKFFHGDSSFNGDIDKGILLMGATGTGKTMAMDIMKIYQTIDNVCYVLNGKPVRMNFEITDVSMLVNSFLDNGYDGLEVYNHRYALCIDDIGSESNQIKYYGNDLDVIGYVLAERYARRLMTFGTTNYKEEFLTNKYGDRIVSRMYALFNFIVMKGKDFRRV
jgi:DNA replication protein DnaC